MIKKNMFNLKLFERVVQPLELHFNYIVFNYKIGDGTGPKIHEFYQLFSQIMIPQTEAI